MYGAGEATVQASSEWDPPVEAPQIRWGPWISAWGARQRPFALDSHNCVILDDDTIKCWGRRRYGQLGYGDTTTKNAPPATPVDLGAGRTAKAVSCGAAHTCAILDDDTLKCWGMARNGQLGIGDPSTAVIKQPLLRLWWPRYLGAGVKSVAAGQYHTCAVLNDGSIEVLGTWRGMASLGYGDTSY